MNKVKNWSIVILTVFVLIVIWQLNAMTSKRNQERKDKERWQSNYLEATKSMLENKNIVLTQKEFLAQKDQRITRLMDSLKIKPKIVVKYEERLIIQKEIDTVEVEVVKIASGVYTINDQGPCFVWTGTATIFNRDSLNVVRNAFLYENSTQDLYYRKQKGRILFWKTYYKDKIDHVSVPQCGTSATKTIEVLR